MSIGSLGEKAIESLNRGAKLANCYHNTGEGGLSPFHATGADVIFQMGKGYFEFRDEKGKFSIDKLKGTVNKSFVRGIEIKSSQGEKPGKGGVLLGKKVTAQFASIRRVKIGEDCISPNGHSEFTYAHSLILFIEKIAAATGLPVGIKSAIGQLDFWNNLADEMIKTHQGLDWITIDGGEGGTSAAPLTFADHVALP